MQHSFSMPYLFRICSVKLNRVWSRGMETWLKFYLFVYIYANFASGEGYECCMYWFSFNRFENRNTLLLISKDYWNRADLLKYSKANLENIDGLKECVKNTSGEDYGSFILESRAVWKAISASSLDMNFGIYNNPRYSNKTFEMFKKNYGANFSYGAWTIYEMRLSEKERAESEAVVQMLIDNGVDRLYTEDTPRLLRKLGRSVRRNSALSLMLFSI